MDYRAREMTGKNHVAATSDNEERMLLQELAVEQLPEVVEAVGLRVAYDSPIGPISADLHWNNLNRRVGAYMNIGYVF